MVTRDQIRTWGFSNGPYSWELKIVLGLEMKYVILYVIWNVDERDAGNDIF